MKYIYVLIALVVLSSASPVFAGGSGGCCPLSGEKGDTLVAEGDSVEASDALFADSGEVNVTDEV